MARLDWWHTKLCGIGSRKLVVLLRQEGYKVGRKLVRRLMQEMGLYTVYPKENLSKRNFKEAIVPYLLRNRQIQFSNEVWSVDITYVKLQKRHMYLTAIIDWHSRKIMGWETFGYVEHSAGPDGGPQGCGEIRDTGHYQQRPGKSVYQQ